MRSGGYWRRRLLLDVSNACTPNYHTSVTDKAGEVHRLTCGHAIQSMVGDGEPGGLVLQAGDPSLGELA